MNSDYDSLLLFETSSHYEMCWVIMMQHLPNLNCLHEIGSSNKMISPINIELLSFYVVNGVYFSQQLDKKWHEYISTMLN